MTSSQGNTQARIPSSFLLPPSRPVAALTVHSWLLAAMVFAAGILLYNRHNDFPCFYHPDEPKKARQVIEGEFNFKHPLLLLQATRVAAWINRQPLTPQPVTETGRMVSALFTSAAIVCFVLLAAHLYGTLAAACVGALLLANSHLYELAHYMKEDPALAFGIGAFFLAMTRCWLRPSIVRFALLGAAAALAVSAKYAGAIVVPIAFVPLFWLREERGRKALALCTAFVVAVVLVNFPIFFTSLSSLLGNVGREVDFTVHGEAGLTRRVPHGVYTAVFVGATNPVIWILLGVYYLRFFKFFRSIHPAEWLLALFPILYMVILSFLPKTNHRYFLPDTLIFCTLAAFGLFSFSLGGSARLTRAVQAACFLAAFGIFVARLIPYDFAFRVDTRQQLLAFIRENVPPDATIAQDRRVRLPSRTEPRDADSTDFLAQKVVGGDFAADPGGIDALRARGVSYVAVSEAEYGRFFLPNHKPSKSVQADYDRQKKFYEHLFRDAKLLWECQAGLLPILQPHMRLYYLPPGDGAASRIRALGEQNVRLNMKHRALCTEQ